MENNNPADRSGRRYGAKLGIQIAGQCNGHLDAIEENLLQAIRDMYSNIGLAHVIGAPIMLIYTMVKNVRRKLIFEIGRQDIGPRLRLAYAIISVTLGCVTCSLLMYILLGDMPWWILVPCVMMLIISFEFEPED